MLTVRILASAAALAATLTVASAAVKIHAGAALGASVGATGASLSIAAPTTIDAGLGSTSASGALNPNANADTNVSSGPRLAANASGDSTATVRTIGNGTITLTTQGGSVITIAMTPVQVRQLGLHPGSAIALTRTTRGVILTNLDYVRSLSGRGVVRRVADNAITYVNGTGTHTVAFAQGVVRRLHLHRGSAILVSAIDALHVQVSAIAQTSGSLARQR